MTTGQQGLYPAEKQRSAMCYAEESQSCAAPLPLPRCGGPRGGAPTGDGPLPGPPLGRSQCPWLAGLEQQASWLLPDSSSRKDLGRLRKKDDLGRSTVSLSPRGTQSCACQAWCDGNRGTDTVTALLGVGTPVTILCVPGTEGTPSLHAGWALLTGEGWLLVRGPPCGFHI